MRMHSYVINVEASNIIGEKLKIEKYITIENELDKNTLEKIINEWVEILSTNRDISKIKKTNVEEC